MRAMLTAVLLLVATMAHGQDEPTPLPPVDVQGRKSLMDSDRARLDKLVPCVADCDAEGVVPERETLVEELVGVLDVPMLNATPDPDAALKAPTKVRLDDKLP